MKNKTKLIPRILIKLIVVVFVVAITITLMIVPVFAQPPAIGVTDNDYFDAVSNFPYAVTSSYSNGYSYCVGYGHPLVYPGAEGFNNGTFNFWTSDSAPRGRVLYTRIFSGGTDSGYTVRYETELSTLIDSALSSAVPESVTISFTDIVYNYDGAYIPAIYFAYATISYELAYDYTIYQNGEWIYAADRFSIPVDVSAGELYELPIFDPSRVSDESFNPNEPYLITNGVLNIYPSSTSESTTFYYQSTCTYPSDRMTVKQFLDVEGGGDADEYWFTDYVSWIATAAGGFLDAQIFPGFTFGGLLGTIVAMIFVVMVLKYFAGG